jgi:hypothetical protein
LPGCVEISVFRSVDAACHGERGGQPGFSPNDRDADRVVATHNLFRLAPPSKLRPRLFELTAAGVCVRSICIVECRSEMYPVRCYNAHGE